MESTLNPTRNTYFAIDSRDRNLLHFPLASHYEITLDEAVHDVVTMKLLVADVPFVSYLVSAANNTVQVSVVVGATQKVTGTATVPTGNYPLGTDLSNALVAALQGTTPPSTYAFNVQYLTLTDNFSVGCNKPFTLTFAKTGSVALELGYAVGTTYTSVSGPGNTNTLAPPYRRNLHLNPSVILSIYPACVNTSVNAFVNQSFAIITPQRNALSAAGEERIPQKTFNPPIARFSRAVVDFVNYDGSPVDFQNHEHRIELLLVSLRAAKYIPFSGLETR